MSLPNTIICSMLGKHGLAKFCGLLAGGGVCQQRQAETLREGDDVFVHQSQVLPQEGTVQADTLLHTVILLSQVLLGQDLGNDSDSPPIRKELLCSAVFTKGHIPVALLLLLFT